MILVIDNYDSFTYNLVQLLESMYDDVHVITNDALTIDEIVNLNPKGILLSPGPGYPKDAGVCLEVVHAFHDKIPILGICLGHQTIAQAFGSSITKANKCIHGKVDAIMHDQKTLFKNLEQNFQATRYHSLVVDDLNLSKSLMVTARSASDQAIMGIRHEVYPVEGLQFHPESYMTKDGHIILSNFISVVRHGGYYV